MLTLFFSLGFVIDKLFVNPYFNDFHSTIKRGFYICFERYQKYSIACKYILPLHKQHMVRIIYNRNLIRRFYLLREGVN